MTREEEPKRCGRSVVESNEHLTENGSFEAASSKIQDGRDLFACQVKPFHDFFYAGAGFEILEDDGDGHTRVFENPRAAYLSRDAFHRRALRPIQRCHGRILLSIILYLFTGQSLWTRPGHRFASQEPVP